MKYTFYSKQSIPNNVFAALLQLEGGGALLASVQALGCSCATEKQALPQSVSWARRAPCAQVQNECTTPVRNNLQCFIKFKQELSAMIVKPHKPVLFTMEHHKHVKYLN